MSRGIYAELAKLDVGIANAYERVLPRDPKKPVDVPGARQIFKEVIDGKTKNGKPAIEATEAKALLLIIKNVLFTKLAMDYLVDNLVKETAAKGFLILEALVEGGATTRVQGVELTYFTGMLSNRVVGKINFSSPGTFITYSPSHYFAISELMTQGKIEVYSVGDEGLVQELIKLDGKYQSDSNRLLLFAQKDIVQVLQTVVHESTHAVQDWLDELNFPENTLEADAFIADSVAGKQFDPSIKLPKVFDDAASIVLRGQATLDNKNWKAAYKAVQDLMGKIYGYGVHKVPDKPGPNEAAIMKDALNKIRNKAAATSKTP